MSDASLNRDGLPMKEGENVPLTAGVDDADPSTTLHDAAIPEFLAVKDGRNFNLRESHDFHERVEYALMQAGLSYTDAHRYATEAEHKRMRDLGFDPSEIEALAAPFIDMAKHRSKAEGYEAHATLDNQPYRDNGDNKLLKRGGSEKDERCFYDKDGNEHRNPEQYRAIGKIDFILAERDGEVCAIEPNTARVWLSGSTRKQAERGIDAVVRAKGTAQVHKEIDAETPFSQQQLQEIYQGPIVSAEPE